MSPSSLLFGLQGMQPNTPQVVTLTNTGSAGQAQNRRAARLGALLDLRVHRTNGGGPSGTAAVLARTTTLHQIAVEVLY